MHRTIGQTLRAAREARGLSFLDVAHLTRIPAHRVQQLEDDNFAAFGSMAYAKSFLKKYSRYLEVDASEVADSLPQPMLGGPADYRYLLTTHGPWVEKPEPKRRQERLTRATTISSPVPTLVGMFVIFLIGGVLFAKQLAELRHQGPKTEAKTNPEPAPASPVKEEPAKGGLPVVSSAEIPDLQQETVVRAAVLPSSIPAPVSPTTPVRRAEIVK